MISQIVVLVLLSIAFSQSDDKGYSKFCQKGGIHTMTKYRAGPARGYALRFFIEFNQKNKTFPGCGQLIQRELKPVEINDIVNLHNKLRRRVARGEEKLGSNGPQPPAANMPDLIWDKELAEVAQRWADQCNFGHDSCRNVKRFSWVGQNVAISKYRNKYNVTNFVQDWYSEVENFDQRNVKSYNPVLRPPAAGHYTQIVWARTTTIGCGAIIYKVGLDKWTYLVCNYGPGANMKGAKIYEVSHWSMMSSSPKVFDLWPLTFSTFFSDYSLIFPLYVMYIVFVCF